MDMWKKKPKSAKKVERRAFTAAKEAPPPSMSDFGHPMPRLMDYFKGKSTIGKGD